MFNRRKVCALVIGSVMALSAGSNMPTRQIMPSVEFIDTRRQDCRIFAAPPAVVAPIIKERRAIAPWNITYGRSRIGGTVVYISEFDEDSNAR